MRELAAVAVAVGLAIACAPVAERGATGRGAQQAAGGIEGVSAPVGVETLLLILPGAHGHSGAVVLRSGEREVLVDRPYASATVLADGAIESSVLDSTAVTAEFGEALSALPPRPTEFVLYFVEATDRFTEGSLAKLDEVSAAIAKHPAPEISITGHTDTAGSPKRNDKLSLARAQRARQELVRRGIPAECIIGVAGRGERELLIPTEEDVPEPRNRRVQISVR